MARTLRPSRLLATLTVAALGVAGLGPPAGASSSSTQPAGFTPLPAGWENCVLQGVGAPPTPDNLTNLDEWQTAEGGSTDNTAAYNPFNTKRATDSKGAPIPGVKISGGFPAFADWPSGCLATTATLLQSNMSPVMVALKAGDISPPGLFLAEVDKSAWCAPSADGVPCYASKILSGELLALLLSGGSGQLKDALVSYAGAGDDLSVYETDAAATAVDQALVTADSQQLVTLDSQLTSAREQLSSVKSSLQRVAVDDYTNDGLVTSNSHLQLFPPTDPQGEFAQYLGAQAVTSLAGSYSQAQQLVRTATSQRDAAVTSVTQASTALAAAITTQNQALAQLESDAAAIEVARSCASPPVVTTADSPSPPASGPGSAQAGPPSKPSGSPPSAQPSAPQPASAPAAAAAPSRPAPPGSPTQPGPGQPAPTGSGQGAGQPPDPSVTAGALWTQLQGCLSPATGPPAGSPPTRS
ncbi:MAG TPA: hypothetical protein VKU86_07060 [Acidimicrobiales bacterium]|nr:hypothetical protein [Acidimicrobiales bacterium]